MLEKTGDQNVVLDAVSMIIDWYIAHGFRYQTKKIKFFTVKITRSMKRDILSKYDTKTLTESTWSDLMEYDSQVYTNFDRTRLLRVCFTGDDVRVAVAMEAGKIVGYGSIYRKPNGEYGLRNIFGDNEDVIEAILHNMLSVLPEGTVVYFMMPEDKPLPKYIQHSITDEETATGMYNKFKIEINNDNLWIMCDVHFTK